MQVNYQLRRQTVAAPASALLLLSHNAADLMRLLASLDGASLPPVFAVADGFLVKLPQPSSAAIGGVVRLRSMAHNLFLPVDAKLEPALLSDEAADLVRQRGLIFFPGGRVLEFDPAQPVSLSKVLRAAKLRRDPWRPLPEQRPLAEQLTEISLERPEISPDDLLAAGGADIGVDEPDPKDTSLASRAMGKTQFGAGKAMAWLGKLLGMKGLAAKGMKWMESGLEMAPRLAESVLGKQEATLRDLLRAFREGKIEQALRRALPLGDAERGAAPTSSTRLPFHDLIYSLRNLVGDAGGTGGIWQTDADLYQELQREYRRQAELAAQRGDYRRAAFIHGKLLRDFRAAAAVLSAGGLHRDAAILYLKRLDDPLAAAREFESAGEIDRALALYRRRGEHVLAGDLLRRAGEEEQALAEYQVAAEKLLAAGKSHYEAGELMRTRAGREDLALPYYQTGWQQRPGNNAVPCAVRLAQVYTRTEATEKLFMLANEATEYLRPSGNDGPAAEFYNELARLANRFGVEQSRDGLRDLALTGLAGKLRQKLEMGTGKVEMVSNMLAAQVWPTSMVGDAEFAVRRSLNPPRRPSVGIADCIRLTVKARLASVTAVCQAAHSGDIFLGFESGEVICFQPATDELIAVTDETGPIQSLAVTLEGDALVVLSRQGHTESTLKGLARPMAFRETFSCSFSEASPPELCAGLTGSSKNYLVGIRIGTELRFLEGPLLVPWGHCELAADGSEPEIVFLLPSAKPTPAGTAAPAIFQHGFVFWDRPSQINASETSSGGWSPGTPATSRLLHPVLNWLSKGTEGLELAGIDTEGNLYVSDVRFQDGKLAGATTKALSGNPPYLAAAIIRPGHYAAVTKNAICWLRRGPEGLRLINTMDVPLPTAIACFWHQRGRELIVVCADGVIIRVPASV